MTISKLSYIIFLGLIMSGFLVQAQTLHPIEDGVSITDPAIVRLLESNGWHLAAAIGTGDVTPAGFFSNSKLEGLSSLKPMMDNLKFEFEDYQSRNPKAGIGLKFGKRLFDYNYLKSPLARFALVGVINRMDRHFVETETCGETRLIYRLAYAVNSNGENVSSRLPMTLNLVMGAKAKGSAESCAEIAKRWIEIGQRRSQNLPPKEIVKHLMAPGNILSIEKRSAPYILRIETNLQIVRWPAVVKADFGGHAEYLLKVFKYFPLENVFRETVLENQIDRDRILKDPVLLAQFKTWLMQKENTRQLDQGTIIIPDQYLATRAFSTAPGGLARAANRPFLGFFSTQEIEQILKTPEAATFDFIKSKQGFQRRLDEITCTGCHQTRTVAGFHFMGRDPLGRYPGNSVFAPASPHFYGELPRRRMLLEALAKNQKPDDRRGFAGRPAAIFSNGLTGTGLFDAWGAHCSFSDDPSFKDWTCGQGLICRNIIGSAAEPGRGICLPETGHAQVGDPVENGQVSTDANGNEIYVRSEIFSVDQPERYTSQPQSATPGNKTGGFPGSMLHLKTCDSLTKEASCGPLPGSKNGFNDCLGKGTNFLHCLRDFSSQMGLRGCNVTAPCRDDYICAEGNESERGVCVPPYFLFQFRVDGHPQSLSGK